jgi:REP element-mobilizing transposase RayT
MPQLYKNKFQTKSMRLKDWDYSHSGFYFVTVCAKNHQMFFGDILKSRAGYCPIYKMNLSEIGKVVEKYWLEIPEHFSNARLRLDEFIIMPNHLHGIIEICNNDVVSNSSKVETQQCCVSTKVGVNRWLHTVCGACL